MTFVPAITLTQLKQDQRVVAVINKQKILFIWHNEHVHAIQAQCPHLKLPLKKGQITSENTIICPFHKSEFDLNNGQTKCWSPWPPVVGPLLGKMTEEKNLKVYATQIEGDQILVDVAA